MALYDLLGDRIGEQCLTAPGTGASFSLDATPPEGYSTFAATLASGVVAPNYIKPIYIAINGNAAGGGAPNPGTVYELSYGQYTPGSPNTLARAATPIKSSNAGNKVNWTATHLPILIFSFSPADILNSILLGHWWTSPPAWFLFGPWWGQGSGASARVLYFRTSPSTDIPILYFNESTGAITLAGTAQYVDLTSGQAVAGNKEFTGVTTLKNASTILKSTTATTVGPILTILHDKSVNGATNDVPSTVLHQGKSDNGTTRTMLTENVIVASAANGSESALKRTYARRAGSDVLELDIGGGIVAGAPTGGAKGSATVNATTMYEAGVRLLSEVSAAVFQDQAGSAVDGGAPSAAAWTKWPLDTEVSDPAALASISSNVVTLAAGTYIARWRACFYGNVGNTQTRLRNTSDGATLGLGTNFSNTSDTISSHSSGECRFTITGSKAIELQYYCSAVGGSGLLGKSSGSGEQQVYAVLSFERVAY